VSFKRRLLMDKNLLKENRQHGDILLPIEVYYMPNINSSNILDCHCHDELEFLIVTEGQAIFQIETSYFEVFAGQAIFINSDEIHAGFSLGNSICSYYAIVFDPVMLCSNTYDTLQIKFIEPIIKKIFTLPKHLRGELSWEKEVLSHLHFIIKIFNSKCQTYELIVKAHLYLIFSELILNNSQILQKKETSADKYKTERLKSILNYIHFNYSSKISIKVLADQINLSEGHFCRFFKQMTRRTPIDYINYYRIIKASKLLENSDKKIFDIAMDVGFYNFSYFINIFNHYMKCTPSEYRSESKLYKLKGVSNK
jgi:AraC-like DNA-binding protein